MYAAAHTTTMASKTRLEVPASVDVAALEFRLRRIEQAVGTSP